MSGPTRTGVPAGGAADQGEKSFGGASTPSLDTIPELHVCPILSPQPHAFVRPRVHGCLRILLGCSHHGWHAPPLQSVVSFTRRPRVYFARRGRKAVNASIANARCVARERALLQRTRWDADKDGAASTVLAAVLSWLVLMLVCAVRLLIDMLRGTDSAPSEADADDPFDMAATFRSVRVRARVCVCLCAHA